MLLRCGTKTLNLSQPVVMGILNVTPDSFSDGGQFFHDQQPDLDRCLRVAEQMCADGASILDVGGESTRPGALPISSDEEMARVLPVVEALTARLDVVVSVDTSNPQLIIESAKCGAGIINDVRALQREGALAAAFKTGLPVCLMHMQGEPDTMQIKPDYAHVVRDVTTWLQARADACVAHGIAPHNILLDPGFGFGKTLAHNLTILKSLDQLTTLGYPLLVGLSRKSFVRTITGRDTANCLHGSVAMAQQALDRGAAILRVHDVSATTDMLKIWQAVHAAT